MFREATQFNQPLDAWDVSRITQLRRVFYGAEAFERELCGFAWVNSKAYKEDMFLKSPGSIASAACTSVRPDHDKGEGHGYLG